MVLPDTSEERNLCQFSIDFAASQRPASVVPGKGEPALHEGRSPVRQGTAQHERRLGDIDHNNACRVSVRPTFDAHVWRA